MDKGTLSFSVYVQTFSNRPNFSDPARSLPEKSHVRLAKERGFWRGNVVVGETDDGSTVRNGSPIGNFQTISRQEGEVDLGIMFAYGQTPSPLMVALASDLLDLTIPFLA